MSMTDERLVRALERRLEIALNAPPEWFSAEIAAFLGFVAASPELRAVVGTVLGYEAQRVKERRQQEEERAHTYALHSTQVARVLLEWLRPWVADGTLPAWVGNYLEQYDTGRALVDLKQGNEPWAAVRDHLIQKGLYSGELVRLMREVETTQAGAMLLHAAAERQAITELTGTLARLCAHVRHGTGFALLPEWAETLGASTDEAWERSSLELLQDELTVGGGNASLRAGLAHDLRRLSAVLVEGLEARPPALPLLERFRQWCERYEQATLLQKAKPGRKATEVVRKRKRALLVTEVLRMLHREGFTPVTFEMLASEHPTALDTPRRILIEVLLANDHDLLIHDYVTCIQTLRASERVVQLGIHEAFLVAFLVTPSVRYIEPAALPVNGVLLRSLFIDLTPSNSVRRPLSVEAIAARVAEEDKLFAFLNTAGEDTLDAIPGIGPSKITQIIDGRPYGSASDLQRAGLPSAGKLYETLREYALRGTQVLIRA